VTNTEFHFSVFLSHLISLPSLLFYPLRRRFRLTFCPFVYFPLFSFRISTVRAIAPKNVWNLLRNDSEHAGTLCRQSGALHFPFLWASMWTVACWSYHPRCHTISSNTSMPGRLHSPRTGVQKCWTYNTKASPPMKTAKVMFKRPPVNQCWCWLFTKRKVIPRQWMITTSINCTIRWVDTHNLWRRSLHWTTSIVAVMMLVTTFVARHS